jgi:DNA-binding NarL/FixJ family response regulator
VVSAQCDADWVARAANAGASAFAPKSGSLTEMLAILRQARGGASLVPPSTLRRAAALVGPISPLTEKLTSRERDVLRLMGVGIPPAQIARALNISLHTCRGYVKSIHGKLGASSQLEAVLKAQQLGLIDANT